MKTSGNTKKPNKMVLITLVVVILLLLFSVWFFFMREPAEPEIVRDDKKKIDPPPYIPPVVPPIVPVKVVDGSFQTKVTINGQVYTYTVVNDRFPMQFQAPLFFGDKVRKLQEFLKSKGQNALVVHGVFGQATENSLVALGYSKVVTEDWYNKNVLGQSGGGGVVVNPPVSNLSFITVDLTKVSFPIAEDNSYTPTNIYRKDAIKNLQTWANSKASTTVKLGVDGAFGAKTKEALQKAGVVVPVSKDWYVANIKNTTSTNTTTGTTTYPAWFNNGGTLTY